MENYIFWSEIRSRFGERSGTSPPRIPRSKRNETLCLTSGQLNNFVYKIFNEKLFIKVKTTEEKTLWFYSVKIWTKILKTSLHRLSWYRFDHKEVVAVRKSYRKELLVVLISYRKRSSSTSAPHIAARRCQLADTKRSSCATVDYFPYIHYVPFCFGATWNVKSSKSSELSQIIYKGHCKQWNPALRPPR